MKISRHQWLQQKVARGFPFLCDVGPVLQYLYHNAQKYDLPQDDNDVHMIFIDDDKDSIQELINGINRPEIRSRQDICRDIESDLQKFPKLHQVFALNEDDAVVTCYGAFRDYFIDKTF